VNVTQPVVDRHLVDILQSSTQARMLETRMLACQKILMISYWGIMRHQQGYKRFSSTILVPEKYIIIILQLSTHGSQPSLLKNSFLIHILRPWQSAKGARTGTNEKKQSKLSLTRFKKERCSLT
jgi:hypothetical protein